MTVTPLLMLDTLVDERRKDLKATAGARRRGRRNPQIDACSHETAARTGLLSRFRHATVG